MTIWLIPSAEEELVGQEWCLEELYLNGKHVKARTVVTTLTLMISGCEETIRFNENGMVTLPGIDSRAVKARWELTGDNITISEADILGDVYNGLYSLKLQTGELHIYNGNTVITAKKPW